MMKEKTSKFLVWFFTVAMILYSHQAPAVNRWFVGKLTSVITYGSDGSFMAHLDHPEIKSICAYDRVIFRVSDMGAERTRAALSMALTAFTADKKWGVVIDLPTVPETVCYASSTASQGASIQ